MNFNRCTRLACTLLLGAHWVHFWSYQGVPPSIPQPVGAATAPDTCTPGVQIHPVKTAARFDSEAPAEPVESGPRAHGGHSGGNDVRVYPEVTAGSGTAYDATVRIGPPGPAARFDSEEPPREVEARLSAPGAQGGGGRLIERTVTDTALAVDHVTATVTRAAPPTRPLDA